MQQGLEYYIFDTETTGLKLGYHEINQISVLRVKDSKQITFQIKLKNPNVYDRRALEVQGITPKDLKEGIPLEEAVEKIDAFLQEDGKTKAHRCIIAHNAPFDRKFLQKAWDSVTKEFLADLWICTQSFAKRFVKKHGGTKVAEMQIKNGIDIKKDRFGNLKPKFGLNNFMMGIGLEPKTGAHNAHVDVLNTEVLYNWLMNSNTEYLSLVERRPHKEKKVEELDIDDF